MADYNPVDEFQMEDRNDNLVDNINEDQQQGTDYTQDTSCIEFSDVRNNDARNEFYQTLKKTME